MYIKQSLLILYIQQKNNMGNQSYVNICHVHCQVLKNIMYTTKYTKIYPVSK